MIQQSPYKTESDELISRNVNTEATQSDDSLDLRKYIFLILANWYWFAVSISIALGIAYMVNRYTKPVYRTAASLMLKEGTGRSGLSGYENLIPGMQIYSQQKFVINEIEVLKSYSLANKALQELDFGITYLGIGRSGLKEAILYNTCPFTIELDSSKTNLVGYPVEIDLYSDTHYEVYIDDKYNIREKVEYGKPFNSKVFNFTLHLKHPDIFIPGERYNKYRFFVNNLNGLTNIYRSKLNVSSNDERRGTVLSLSITGYSPEQISEYLNKLLDVYIKQGLEEKNQTATNTVKFIDSQLGIIDDSLQQAEFKLQNFRLSNNLVSLSSETNYIYDQLDRLEMKKAELNLQGRYFDYLVNYINNPEVYNEILAPAMMDISDKLLSGLIEQLNILINQKEELHFALQKTSSQMEVINQKIENTRKALSENINGLIQNNKQAINEVQKDLDKVQNSLLQIPVTERQLIGLEREYKVNDQIYTYLLEKRSEAAIARASNVADNKILDIAMPENTAQISPNTKSNYLVGFILGIGLPMAILILLELINNKIATRGDIERRTKIPIVAHIGHSSKGDVPVFENPKSSLAESFRGLRTNLQYLLRDPDNKVITVTSTVSGEGKTFVSQNLAAIFALAGKKTLLVGLDLRKPKISKVFNLLEAEGLSTYLIGKTSFNDIVHNTDITNLFITPSGPVPPNPAELLDTLKLKEFVESARKDFDIIILDTPPFGVVTDALLVGRHSDCTLFLIRQNYSSREVLDLMNEIQIRHNLQNLGIVFNDLKLKGYYRAGYKYYNYKYTYKYGYIYGSEYYGKE